jgi:zinc transport system substrate-binding protein
MRIFFLFATLLLFFLNIRCDFQKTPTTPTGNQTFTIRTTFYPLTEFTQRLVGSSAKVECLLPAGEDPIFWKPSSEVIQKYQESDLIVINGASFEQWVSTASLPSKKLVDTAKSFKEQWVENAQTHSHGKQGEHSHTGVDGHTWVSPAFALQQVDTLKEALIKALPEKKETFEKNYLALKKI